MPISGDDKKTYMRTYHQETRKVKNKRSRKTHRMSAAADVKVVFTMRLPESLVARIVHLTHLPSARARHGWDSPSEVARYLIYQGFERMKDDPDIASLLPWIRIHRALESLKLRRQEAFKGIHELETEMKELLGHGFKQEALNYYHAMKQSLLELPDTVWRTWALDQMKKRFKDFDGTVAPGVPLQKAKVVEIRVVRGREES